ncbi:unnamed protein product [Blepharisma stoltei]|uniref:Uncharacterized protein n=1 Tax=Blepharisma stoltei TaxID=1481888 RepID=A0AAU9JL72_9CILI|nr:unnamed protein product [Blepharisma stoltei]
MTFWIATESKNIYASEPKKKPKAVKNMKKRKTPKKLVRNFHPRCRGWRVSHWRKMRWEYNGWDSSQFMDFPSHLSYGENAEKEIKNARAKIEENKDLEQKLTEIKESNKEKKLDKAKKYKRRGEYLDVYKFKLSTIEDAMLEILSKI